jgi:hypothetical protein
VYFGRNFDWAKGRAMIVHTVPDDGYESLSTCDLDFLGFGDDYTPDGSMQERIQTLAAIYVPLDGMNEKGLVIADLMDDGTLSEEDLGSIGQFRLFVPTAPAMERLLVEAGFVDVRVHTRAGTRWMCAEGHKPRA